MPRDDGQREVRLRRVRASWRAHAAGAAMACGAQVFLVGAGAAAPICLNAAWLCALWAAPVSAATALLCHRALTKPAKRQGRFARMLRAALCAGFVLCAVFASASLISLAEHSLLPQTRATHSVFMTALAICLCALCGAGAGRLAFALRYALPLLLAALCAASLPLDVTTGLFPLLGAGAGALLPGCAMMTGAAFPVLMLLAPPPDLARHDRDELEDGLPGAWFFVWRVALGAGGGAALLFALTLGSTPEAIAASGAWGMRLLLISQTDPREGIAQTGLTLVQVIAIVLLGAQMLLAAARCAGIRARGMGLAFCCAGFALALVLLLRTGMELALLIVPALSALLVICGVFHRALGGEYGA